MFLSNIPGMQEPIVCVERAKAGSPESSDSDSVDGNGPSKAPSLVPRGTDLGKRVLFYSSHDKKEKYGVLRFVGEPEFAEGTWCGIELDKPDGKNNGSRHGIRYFNCEQNHGVFVPLSKVELDMSRRSRSRPNSAPSSRTPSVERTPRKPKSVAPAAGGGGGGGGGGKAQLSCYMLQQELVNRLATPTMQKRKTATPGRGGPMKAFATKGVGMESLTTPHQHKKPTLSPFKSGGIQKAVSSENLRSLKEKEKRTPSGGMTGKKSSSQKDLRSSGPTTTTTSGKGISSGFQGKNRRKPIRANSHSDLFDNGSTNNSGSSNSKSKTSSDINFRKSADLSSLSDTQLICSWPRTSTPGNRSDQTPDGCSSPEGAELSDSRSTTSSTGDTTSSFSEKTDTDNNTPATQERGFIVTPNGSLSATSSSSVNGSVALDSPPTGLVTQTSQFVRSEKKSPSVEMCRVATPDGANTKQVYKNRPSGSATLPHPLTLQAAGLTNGVSENGIKNGGSNTTLLLSPNSFKKNFLGPNVTVS
jgi:hypothetical protein